MKTKPLIRLRPDGTWERLVIGSLGASAPRYEPCVWDMQAWEDKQRLSAAARLLELPSPLEVAA